MGDKERHTARGGKLVASENDEKHKQKKKRIRKVMGEARWSVI